MAPGPVPNHTPLWRDVHSFYLLSPLMGFFSRAWSRLRSPGAPEPWLVETITGTSQIEDKTLLTTSLTPQSHHSQGEAEDGGTPEEVGQAAHKSYFDMKVSSSPLETWGPSDDEEYSGEEHVLRECTADLPTPLPSSLQGADKSPREEVAEKEGVTGLAYPSLHWEWCPVTEGERGGETVKREGPGVSPCIAPRSKPNTWVYCPGEAEHQATEKEGPENKVRKPSTSPSSGCHPRAWPCCSGKESKESDADLQPSTQCQPSNNSRDGEAEASSSALVRSAFLKAWVYRPGEDTEEEEEDDSDLASAEEEEEAKTTFCTPPPSDFLKAWVYKPGEDSEEEDDSDWESAKEGELSSCSPPPSAFLKAWVYHPGEDTEEEDDRDSGSAEEKKVQASPATSLPSAFLKSWVCVPGEDTEEEDLSASNSGQSLAVQAQGTPLCCLSCPPQEETQEDRWREAEPSPFQVAFYLPGQKPASPWAAPKLPVRLQKQLRSSDTPAQDQDPETPVKARKVRFSEKVTVHLLAVWAGPAQAARRGPWEQLARDRSRFARRIAQAQELLGPCFTPASRARAWARLGNPLPPLATPLIPVVATPSSPSCETPLVLGLGLSGKRG
uniref:Protein phosphatase 1 regulatory subunit 15A n=1 Tax=Jaculus jaculus TaxID=51337 RepID=A0A8C5KH89_JACJA